MQDDNDLFAVMRQAYPKMSKGQKVIADFINANYDKAARMTAAKLGQSVGISESTVVRFASELGYAGYPQMQRAVQEMARNRLTTLQRMELTDDMTGATLLRSVLRADLDNLRQTMERIDGAQFEAVADKMYEARRIYLLGVRSSAPLVQFMGYYLSYIMDNVRIVTSGINDILEQLVHIEKSDVLVAVSFPRYSRRTLDGVRYAHERGASVIAITDTQGAPLCRYADNVLVAQSNTSSFVDSLVSPFSVANALIAYLGLRKRREASAKFAALERIWEDYHVYMDKETRG